MKYKFDHIIDILLHRDGWLRVPWWVPQDQEREQERSDNYETRVRVQQYNQSRSYRRTV